MVVALGPSSVALEASAAPPAVADRAHARTVPTRTQWLADVKTAMEGSRPYVRERVASADADERLAINFDIDNTVLASYYDGGGPIPLMTRFSRLLARKGVAMVFNTGRATDQRARTIKQLTRAGFPIAALCLRNKGETLPVRQAALPGQLHRRGLHADRERRQQRHRLHGRRLRAGLPAAQLRRRARLSTPLP